MEFTIKEAVKAIQDATKNGYSVELVINGEYYTINHNQSRDIICYEVLRTGGKENV